MSSRTQDHDAQAQATGRTQRHTNEKTVFRSSQAAINCDEDIREKEVTIRLPRAAGEGGHMEPSLVPLGTAEARVKYIRSSPEYRIQCTMSVIHYCIYCRLYHLCVCAHTIYHALFWATFLTLTWPLAISFVVARIDDQSSKTVNGMPSRSQ